jgi:hypothetical protein
MKKKSEKKKINNAGREVTRRVLRQSEKEKK